MCAQNTTKHFVCHESRLGVVFVNSGLSWAPVKSLCGSIRLRGEPTTEILRVRHVAEHQGPHAHPRGVEREGEPGLLVEAAPGAQVALQQLPLQVHLFMDLDLHPLGPEPHAVHAVPGAARRQGVGRRTMLGLAQRWSFGCNTSGQHCALDDRGDVPHRLPKEPIAQHTGAVDAAKEVAEGMGFSPMSHRSNN